MDLEEARRVVYTRVQCLDSANVLKIMGYLLLQDIGEQDMLQLALSSDSVLQSFVHKAKHELGLADQYQEQYFSDQDTQDNDAGLYMDEQKQYVGHLYDVLQQQQMLKQEAAKQDLAELIRFNPVNSVNPSSSSALAWKPCLYFARGYCKHGSSCRFLHAPAEEVKMGSPEAQDNQDMQSDTMILHTDILEAELRELLSGKKAPVSIASLPQLYYEKFGKTLQAEGYLTESQRHGKVGYSLTKLLAKLKSTVTLIDRPHGQHAVVLAEDAHKFVSYRGDSDDSNSGLISVNPSSRQIYLTFPAESSFTEEDVTNHFSAYGPVQDVRIPYQQKRMFGFVTFTYSDTVRQILAEGNPHYICGARVLVKPYKEKAKIERKSDQQVKLLQSRSFDRNRHQQAAALRYYLQDRAAMTEDDLTLALQQKLAELHFANVQKRIAETDISHLLQGSSAAAPPPVPAIPTYLDTQLFGKEPDNLVNSHPLPDLPQLHNPYGYVLDVLDNDPADEVKPCTEKSSQSSSNTEHVLPCNIQSDKKFMAMPCSNSPPTFFSQDIF